MSKAREKWAERVAKWRSSGLSQAEFARREGLKTVSLRYWHNRLTDTPTRKPSSRRRASEPEAALELVQLEAIGEAPRIEVISEGVTARVPEGVDAATCA